MPELQIVYVVTNPAMPNLVKIGITRNEEAGERISQLYSTSVPFPFKLEYACKVSDAKEVESALHMAFGPYRVNPKREFFKVAPEQVVAILKLLHTEDATSSVSDQPSEVDLQSIQAAEQYQKRRPNLNFEEMGIPTDAVLDSVHDTTTVAVVSPKKVLLSGEEMSLTAATQKVLKISYSVAPGPHWSYQGKLIREIYEETYGDIE